MILSSGLQLLARNVLLRLKNIPKLVYTVITFIIIVLNLLWKLFLVFTYLHLTKIFILQPYTPQEMVSSEKTAGEGNAIGRTLKVFEFSYQNECPLALSIKTQMKISQVVSRRKG